MNATRARSREASVRRHLPPSELPVAWVRLDKVHLLEIADHMAEVAQRGALFHRTEYEDANPRYPTESAEEYRERIEQALEWRLADAQPDFWVSLNTGESASSNDLRAVLDQVSAAEVTYISLKARKGPAGLEVEVALPLTGAAGEVKIRADTRADLDAETGFFGRYLSRRRSWVRYLTLGYPIGFIGWVLLPAAVAVAALYRLARWNLGMAGAVTVAIYAYLFMSCVAWVVARITTNALVPKVQIDGFGPHQSLRRTAEALVVGVLASAIFGAILVVVPWLVGA